MSRRAWAIRLGALAAFLVALAATVILISGTRASHAEPATQTASSLASSSGETRAAAEVRGLLARFQIPADLGFVVPTSGAASVAGINESVGTLTAASAPNAVLQTRRLTVAVSAATVRAALLSHPPAGTRGRTVGPDELRFVVIDPPTGLSSARVDVTVLPTGPHSTTVVAQATAAWSVERAASERVPLQARVAIIARGRPGRAPDIVRRLVNPAQVRELAAAIDALPVVQPGAFHCPAKVSGLPEVTFTFRASAGGPILAQATQVADATSPTTACDAMHFTVNGQARTPLLGGAQLLREVSRAIGVRLWLAPYAA